MEETHANDMENMSIPRLGLKISMPMVISMIAIALYGIVDTIFVSTTGEKALTAISLAYPFINTITAVALGIGVGVNSLLAKTIGEKNNEKANKVIVNGIIISLFSWIFIALISLIGIGPFFRLFSNDVEMIELGKKYLFIIAFFSIGSIYQILFEKVLEANGKTKESMFMQIIGAVINLILDPILIYGFLFIKPLGLTGAAIATVIGQTVGMILGAYLIIKNKIFTFSKLKHMKIQNDIMKDICKVGVPTMILEAVSSFITVILNKVLIGFSDLAVVLWGIYEKVQKFVIIIVYGLNYGMIPIVAYNFGAKRKDRINEAIKFFLKLSSFVTGIGMLFFLIIPDQLISMFEVSSELIELGKTAFRILSLGFIFAGISLTFSGVFQSLGNATYSLIVNLSRKIIIALPIIFIFKNIFGVTVVWWAFTIAEVITTIVAIVLYRHTYKNVVEKL